MKTISKIISWIALAATILLPGTYLAGRMELTTLKTCLMLATVVWFIATPVWMKRDGAT